MTASSSGLSTRARRRAKAARPAPALDALDLLDVDDAAVNRLRRLRSQAIICYDTAKHALRPAVLQCLDLPVTEPDSDERTLEGLRGSADTRAPTSHKERIGYRGASTCWINRWYNDDAAEAKGKPQWRWYFKEVYHSFLRDVVLKDIGDPRGILFQRDPTFRCHVTGGGAPTGRQHCDSEYGHQTTELNYWLPLTRVSGSNSLYAESAPGAGDFAPFEARYGEVVRFWGASCEHYTTANESGRTRVSLDFRVVPRSCYYEGTHFVLGGFYLAMLADGSVPDLNSTHLNEARRESQQRRKEDVRAILGARVAQPAPPLHRSDLHPCTLSAPPSPRPLRRLVVQFSVDFVARGESSPNNRGSCDCRVRIEVLDLSVSSSVPCVSVCKV